MTVLADPEERKRLSEGAASPEAGMLRGLANWANMEVNQTFAPENEGLAGRTVGDIAAERGQEPFDTLCDIVVADGLATVICPPVAGDDDESWKLRRDIWRDPRAIVGASDAGAHLDMLVHVQLLDGDAARVPRARPHAARGGRLAPHRRARRACTASRSAAASRTGGTPTSSCSTPTKIAPGPDRVAQRPPRRRRASLRRGRGHRARDRQRRRDRPRRRADRRDARHAPAQRPRHRDRHRRS